MTTLKLDIDEYRVVCEILGNSNKLFNHYTDFESKVTLIVLNEILKRLAKKGIDHEARKQHIKLKLSKVEVYVFHEFLDRIIIPLPPYAYSVVVSLVEELNPLIID